MRGRSSAHEKTMKDHKARKQANGLTGSDIELAILLCKEWQSEIGLCLRRSDEFQVTPLRSRLLPRSCSLIRIR